MVFTIHAAHAAFLFVGIKRLNLSPGSTNDCLTIALATMRDQGFANLRRGNDVSGTRAGAFVSALCAPAPGDNSFWCSSRRPGTTRITRGRSRRGDIEPLIRAALPAGLRLSRQTRRSYRAARALPLHRSRLTAYGSRSRDRSRCTEKLRLALGLGR